MNRKKVYISMLKKRFANASSNKDITSREFKYVLRKDKNFNGYISLLKINSVSKICTVPRDGREDDCILDNGYVWLQFYPLDRNYAINAIYDNNLKIVEWYFDIINGTSIENDIPFIEDLYLDVVVTNRFEVIVLDEDELEEAFDIKKITKEQFNMAVKTGKYLIDKYSNKEEVEKLLKFTDSYLKELTKK